MPPIRVMETLNSFQFAWGEKKKESQFLLRDVSGIPVDSLPRLASVTAETWWTLFKDKLSLGETVALPCQNHQTAEKRSECRKDPKCR